MYDKKGRVIEQKDANGRSKFTVYDNLGRVSQQLNEMNQPVTYSYNAVGARTSLKDANNNTTTWTYDALNRATSMVYPNSDTESYAYDRLGRMTSKTKPDTTVIAYAYALDSKPTSVTLAEGAVNFTYDGLRRNTAITSAGGNVSFAYDSAGRLATFTDATIGQSVAYTYNTQGLKATVVACGSTIAYGYDRLGRIATVQKTGEATPATYAYDAAGRRVSLSLPNGVATNYTYNDAGQLSDLLTVNPNNETLARFTYTLDATGNRTAIQQNLGGVVHNLAYAFDNAYRLTGELRTDANNNTLYSDTFAYDAVGNRLTRVKNGVASTYTYNSANQLVSGATGQTTESWTYDANGNQTAHTAVNGGNTVVSETFRYDSLNRMTLAGTAAGTEETVYRGHEWHRSKTRTTQSGTTSGYTNYLYEGDNVIADYLSASGGSGNTGSETLALNRFYVTPLLDQNLSMSIPTGATNAGTYYYTQDGLGSVRTLTTATAALANKYDHAAFGESYAANTATSILQRYTYTGRETTLSAEMMYYRWRISENRCSRLISRDPIDEMDGINIYSYVGNRPITHIDQYGLFAIDEERKRPGGRYMLGHNDFPGSAEFDYSEEDKGLSHPWVPTSTQNHFRDLKSRPAESNKYIMKWFPHRGVEDDMIDAVSN